VKAITVLPATPPSVRPEPAPDGKGRSWLSRVITRKVPLSRWQEVFQRRPEDINVILKSAEAA
jgi:hypothetical protein